MKRLLFVAPLLGVVFLVAFMNLFSASGAAENRQPDITFGQESSLQSLGTLNLSLASSVVVSRAEVIVQLSEEERLVRSVTFTQPITGLAALEQAGYDVQKVDMGWGIAVCSINGVGCPVDDCFCSSNFWNYSYWDGAAWQNYMTGASATIITKELAVEGWRWGAWDGTDIPDARRFLAASKALDWLRSQQVISTGGYGTASSSVESLLAIGANGYEARAWRAATGPTLEASLLAQGRDYARKGAAEAGKLAVGLAASKGCWPVSAPYPMDYLDAASGKFADDSGPQAWAMLGAAAQGEGLSESIAAALKSLVQPNGGWEWNKGFGADTNTTALAIQALLAAGEPPTSTVITQALDYLAGAQNNDGGFPYDPLSPWGTGSDTNSTAYVVQALLAAGEDPSAVKWTQSGNTPYDFLLSMQLADGSFEWQSGFGGNLFATQQAIPALMGSSFPIRVSGPASCPGVFAPVVSNLSQSK